MGHNEQQLKFGGQMTQPERNLSTVKFEGQTVRHGQHWGANVQIGKRIRMNSKDDHANQAETAQTTPQWSPKRQRHNLDELINREI